MFTMSYLWLSMEDGIRPLKTYYDSLDMDECARRAKKISAYIVHKVNEPVVVPPALPSCEAEKETYTSKQPKSANGKRVEHVATKRTSPRGMPPSPFQMLKFHAQEKRSHLKLALAKALLHKASSSKFTSPTETISPSKCPVAAKASSPKEKGPPLAAESISLKQRVPLDSAKTQSSK
ncbi:hypothetical protein Cgig2_010093 [Carnegiea gigantea]|uniref:Uncharacterized protein n=1 Tax=Carnegiea gigantea TaxID=171969 RepID=A0A9Q1K6G6_9CARY|nr:hypothetical protein Cgig2_010093 [Carnegiea gigantea]